MGRRTPYAQRQTTSATRSPCHDHLHRAGRGIAVARQDESAATRATSAACTRRPQMLAPLATRGAVSRPVDGGSVTLRFWTRWPAGVSMFWRAAWLIIAASLPPARADESAAERWQFAVTPYVWMAGLEGTVGVRGITAAVDANFIDILDDTDSVIGLQGHFEARYGPWG